MGDGIVVLHFFNFNRRFMNLKQKKLIITLSTLTLASLSAIPSQAKQVNLSTGGYATEFQKPALMNKIDTNKNNLVSSGEYYRFNDRLFNELDHNNDGFLDQNEWVGKKVNHKNPTLATGGYLNALRNTEIMNAMDEDKDTTVSKAEFLISQFKVFNALDKSKNKELTLQEWGSEGLVS